jgi:exopolysaccharide production protein ExoQ
MATIVEEEPAAETTRLSRTPLWILSGQAGIVIATIAGFGARQSVKPKLFDLLLVLALGGLVLLGPVNRIRRVVVSLSFLTYLTWWLLSYVWTANPEFWLNDTQLIVPGSIMLMVIATVLPTPQFIRGILLGAYGGLAYTTLWSVTHPGPAMTHTDGTAGWSGSFGHKNGLAPFMLYAIFAVLAFEKDPRKRRIALVIAIVTIAMSQSTTTYIVAAVLLPFAHFLRTTAAAPPEVRGTRLLVGSLVVLVVAVVSVTYMPALLDAVGKDPTLSRRTEVWEGVIQAIELEPWTGYGIGGVWFDQAAEPTRTIVSSLGFKVFHSHNGFLEILLQLGAVGMVLFVVFLSSYLRTAIQLMSSQPEMSCFAILFAAMILFTSLSEVTTFRIWLMFLGMFHAGMLRMRADELAAEGRPVLV